MKQWSKILSVILAATLMLSMCVLAQAEDVVELEYVIHKSEAAAINGSVVTLDGGLGALKLPEL